MSNHDLGIGTADSDNRSKIKKKNINHFKCIGESIRRQLPASRGFCTGLRPGLMKFLAFRLVAARGLLT